MGSLFKILELAGTSFALTKVAIGDAVTALLNGILVFAFRDSNGDATLPQLNNEGAVVVSLDAGTCIRNMGKALKGTLTKNVEAEIMNIVLGTSKNYTQPSIRISCYRDIYYRIAKVDDVGGTPVEVEIYEGVLGGSQINRDVALAKDCFSSDATGIQQLKVYATPLDNPDDIYAQASVNELV